MRAGLRVHQGGTGESLLVLLHGLGATGDVWGGWRPLLAQRWPGRWVAPDQRAFAVGAPDMVRLLSQSQAQVTLARGEHDPMNTDEQLARLGVQAVTLSGLGHNAHIESPELSIALIGTLT